MAFVLSAKADSAEFSPAIEVVNRAAIYSIDDRVTSPNNQVHFPFMFESVDGNWYMLCAKAPTYGDPTTVGCRWSPRPERFMPRTVCRPCIRRTKVSRGDRGPA